MASVRQLPTPGKDGKRPWVVDYTDAQGKRRRKTPKSGLQRDAKAIAVKIEAELATGLHLPASKSTTLSKAIDLWYERCDQRVAARDGVRLHTFRNWRVLTENHIRPQLGATLLVDMTVRRVQAWLDGLAYDRVKPAKRPTLVNARNCLNFILKDAFSRGLIAQNIMVGANIRTPGRPSRPIAVPDKQQIRAILEASKETTQGGAAPYLRTMVNIAIFCGLRLGEIRALSWENVDFAQGMIRVRFGMDPYGNIDEPKTPAAVRDVPVPPALSTELKRWHLASGRPAVGLIFKSATGRWVHESALSGSWRRLQYRALGGVMLPCGLPKSRFNFHALRHVYAALLIESGLPPKRVQYLMGHASIKMTFDRYGYLFDDPDLVRSAMDRVGAAFAV